MPKCFDIRKCAFLSIYIFFLPNFETLPRFIRDVPGPLLSFKLSFVQVLIFYGASACYLCDARKETFEAWTVYADIRTSASWCFFCLINFRELPFTPCYRFFFFQICENLQDHIVNTKRVHKHAYASWCILVAEVRLVFTWPVPRPDFSP